MEKYCKFVRDRAEVEVNYAKQLRSLAKKYQPKKNSKEEEESRFTSCRAFLMVLSELNDYAGQHEVISENMNMSILQEMLGYVQELKQERKMVSLQCRKAQQHLEACWKQLESCKKRFERDCKEAEKALQYFDKMDNDINVTKADVEKARQQSNQRTQLAEDTKNEYATQLQKYNEEQNQHYFAILPKIFQDLQDMEEKRTCTFSHSLLNFANIDRQVMPILSKCLDGMTKAAEDINQQNVTHKSGFERPSDVEFEDFSQFISRTHSDSSLSVGKPDGSRTDGKSGLGRSKPKLWPFGKKHKGIIAEDFSHLPPEQRRKKLHQKIDELNLDVKKESDQREALLKMKDVYLRNPQMGDPGSLEPKLQETAHKMEKLQQEVQKFEPIPSPLKQTPSSANPVTNTSVPTASISVPTASLDDDDDFDEDEPLPVLGQCKALYPFEGQSEGTMPMGEDETFQLVEEDKGDGWTRVRRTDGEEGYVPTSYLEAPRGSTGVALQNKYLLSSQKLHMQF
uniref:Formin binding protein 1a n=1 Tax=Eptatretus burgeri TaxID=7764 RepID=A0A8C4R2J9_EPTBU